MGAVAHPGLVQIPKYRLGNHQGIAQIEDTANSNAPDEILGVPVAVVANIIGYGDLQQDPNQQIACANGPKPAQILNKCGFSTGQCS